MHWLRPVPLATIAFVLASLLIPAHAGAEETPAATVAPTLQAPAAGASSFTEGASMTFEWRGALQGDDDALDRSYFRLEVIKASDLPSGSQSPWPGAELFAQTEAGQAETTTQVGVPDAGEYRWRVCAWGVVDDLVDNTIQQIPGGCSMSRAFTTVAAAIRTTTIGELKIETKTQVAGAVDKQVVERPAAQTTTEPEAAEPVATQPNPVTEVVKVIPAIFQPVAKQRPGKTRSAAALGSDDVVIPGDLAAEAAADKERSVGRRVSSSLTSTLPGIPIPFWTLALLLATIPIARAWRRSVLGMFDWADGSVDGSGSFDDPIDALQNDADARSLKPASTTADGSAPSPVADSAPDRRRRAA